MARDADADGSVAVDELLQPGEERSDELCVLNARLVLTDRRLLVIREHDDPPVRAVDRTNLGRVRSRTVSDRHHLASAVQWGGLGVFLLAAWRFVPFEGLDRPVDPPPGAGFQELFETVNTVVAIAGFVDEAFLLVGGLALGWTLARLGLYIRGRQRVLEVSVAGGDSIRLQGPSEEATGRLRTFLEPVTATSEE